MVRTHQRRNTEERVQTQETIDKVVKGKSPIWIRCIITILRVWFYIYDCLNYIPYELFNSPAAKLQKSERMKAKPMKGNDSPWCNVDGQLSSDFPGVNTVDKLFTHVAKMYGEKNALGTRELMEVNEEKQPNGRIFEKWALGSYTWQTYIEVHQRVGRIAAGLKTIAGTNSRAVIFSETRADWLISAFSLFRINVPVVTVYATLGEDAIKQAINETDATILFTSVELLPKVATLGQCRTLHSLVYFSIIHPSKKVENLSALRSQYKNVLSLNELEHITDVSLETSPAKEDDTAMIMYTSGTTGAAKGVILTHKNIVASVAGLGSSMTIINANDTYIGYLPLAHILEFAAELTCLVHGCSVGYSSPLTLHDRGPKILAGTHGDCWALRPTIMASVPAVMDRIFKAVSDEVASSPRLMQELFRLNYERKRARYEEGYCSPFLDRIVFKKIRRLLGGKLRGVLSGGAAMNPETQRFMNICMCCPVIQGYGLTETCAAATIADVNDLSTGTVGPPVRCSQILLRKWGEGEYTPFNDPPQGEVMVGGNNVSTGYWKQPEKTAEDFVMIDGVRYFATGDIGEFREDGSLRIIDRKKDLLKLQHGEYVSLAKVETALLNCPLIDNICVYGSPLAAYLIALIVPNNKHLTELAKEVSMDDLSDWSLLCRNPKVKAEYLKRIEQHGLKNRLMKGELPAKIHLCEEVWSSENGLLTEALKLKRRPLKEKYDKVITKLYSESNH